MPKAKAKKATPTAKPTPSTKASPAAKTPLAKTPPAKTSLAKIPPAASADGAALLTAIAPRLAALPKDRVVMPRTDVGKAATFALGVAQKVGQKALRTRFESLPKSEFDAGRLDDLATFSRAAIYAAQNVKTHVAVATSAKVPLSLAESAAALRERMLRLCDYYFADDDTLSAEVRDIRRGSGYLDLAADLDRLATLYRSQHATISADRNLYQAGDLATASRIADELRGALGESGPASTPKTAVARDTLWRCFALLHEAYNEVAAAGRFLLRHHDGDRLFPSLSAAGREPYRRSKKPAPPAAPPASPPTK